MKLLRSFKYVCIIEDKMKKGTRKNKKMFQIKKITAFIPKTVRATTGVAKTVVKGAKVIFSHGIKTIKNIGKSVDKQTAKSIRSLTRRCRRR